MIKFFRKIRQQLLAHNRFNKYLLYAIGEIVLVVIGILIAVQINAIYNAKKDQKENRVILTRMLSEIHNNIERLERLDKNSPSQSKAYYLPPFLINEQQLDSCYKIITAGTTKENLDYLVANSVFNFSSLSTFTSVYEEMLNTGKIYALGSDDLTSKIDSYYKRIERESFYVNSQIKQVLDSYNDCKYGWHYFQRNYALNKDKWIEQNLWLFDQNSKEFINYSNYIFNARKVTIRTRERIKGLIENSEDLLLALKTYLND